MNLLRTTLIFAMGFLCASVLEHPAGVQAQGGKGNCQSQIDQATLNEVKQRLTKLEKLGCAALGKSRVVAPFKVVDRHDPNNTIFEVTNNSAVLYNDGVQAAEMDAEESGGLIVTRSRDGTVCVGSCSKVTGMAVSVPGASKTPDDKPDLVSRILLGKMKEKKDYALKLFSASGAELAGIGESPETNAGLAFINDGSGSRKAVIAVGKDGRGSIEVVNSGKTVAQLTESVHRGGKLVICSASQCDPPMVSAGDVGGYGVVAAGPLYFNAGAGALGSPNPGSFIEGKQ